MYAVFCNGGPQHRSMPQQRPGKALRLLAPPILQPNTSYEWRVQALCNDGKTLTTSNIATFQTRCQKLNQWSSAVIGINTARFTVSVDNGPGQPIQLQWRTQGATTWQSLPTIISKTYTLTGLSANTTYEAQIATVCSASDISDFVSFQFQTGCKLITDTWVETTGTTARLRWWNSPPDDRYQVQWRLYGNPDWNGITDIAGTSAMLSGLLPDTFYGWRVRVLCPAGDVAFSAIKPFRTGCSSPVSLYVSSPIALPPEPASSRRYLRMARQTALHTG